jgi:hypothetical protein
MNNIFCKADFSFVKMPAHIQTAIGLAWLHRFGEATRPNLLRVAQLSQCLK